ncbi:MAG: hypothetical protein WCC14_09285 [Acidobacteriaceae bacterium]
MVQGLSKFEAERKAVDSLGRLYAAADECRRLYESAGMALPETVLRIFSDQKNSGTSRTPVINIPAIERDSVPPEATEEWISISASAATPTTVALALLRGARHPLRPKELVDAVGNIIPDVSGGSVYNLGFRLEKEGKLVKTEDGWALAKSDFAPVLDHGLIWGPPESLAKQDVAAHRREAILHVLRMDKSGLQIVQLVAKLHDCPWVKAPVNKDLLKADMQVLLDGGKVRQRGNSRKWEAVSEEHK